MSFDQEPDSELNECYEKYRALLRERDELIKMHALACADGAELARVATRRAEERKILEAERDQLKARIAELEKV